MKENQTVKVIYHLTSMYVWRDNVQESAEGMKGHSTYFH